MIELLLVAEQLFDDGAYDRAELLFTQVAQADPRNAIAVAGLARVALARGDHEKAFSEARRALAIDPEEAAAQRLIDELIADAMEPQVDRELAAEPEPGQHLDPISPAAWSEDPAATDLARVQAESSAEQARTQVEAEQARVQASASAEEAEQATAREQAAAAAEARAQAWALAQAGAAEARARAIANAHVAAAEARAEATAVVQAAAEAQAAAVAQAAAEAQAAAVAQAAAASRHVTPEPASTTPERRSLMARLLGLFGIRR